MSLPALRSQDHYKAAIGELKTAGLAWREEFRGKHAALIISVNGREETEILSLTPSDHRAPAKARSHIRRRIKQWKAEGVSSLATETPQAQFPTLEKETVVDTTSEIVLHEVEGEPCARDVDVGERLGFARARDIRPLIERHRTALENFGPISRYRAAKSGRGRPDEGFWLTEQQALYIGAKSDAPNAEAVLSMLINVYTAWRRGQLPVPQYGDDTQALLEMLSELRATVIAAQQSGHSNALEHIDGAKAAVLHYLKAYVKEPAVAFQDDVKARNAAAYKRDFQIISQVAELNRQVGSLLQKAGPIMLDRPFILEEWFDAQRIYTEYFPDRVIPNQRFLSNAIGRALDGECKRRRRFQDMEQQVIGGKPKNFWHRNIVEIWLDAAGHTMVEQHIGRFLPKDQNVLPFVTKGRP